MEHGLSDTQSLPPGFLKARTGESTEEYFINMGPQHPSTHGVLRLVLRLDGETVVEVVPHLGYIHRGIEKQAEAQTYLQYLHLTDRMDYLCSHMNNHAVCLAIEKALGIGVPERGEYLRVIIDELQRIQSHLVFFACFGADLGALTCILQGFKAREFITDFFDEICGSRLTMNFFRPGGSVRDVPDDFTAKVKAICGKVEGMLGEFDRLLTGNLITKERARGIGVLPKAEAIALGCTGPVLRGSGVDYDLRKKAPYGIYDRFEFSVPLGVHGDSWDRYVIRMEEMRQSLRILAQACASFPGGPYRSKEKPAYRLPPGAWFGSVETARGVFSTWIVAEKGEKPWRIHSRSPSLANLAALNPMSVGHKIADLITILATIDPVIPDMDR
jgi:NADH:ubiquinone oxidoreductase subunit D